MNENHYEERLGTAKMLPLVFKMALPAVAAQLVNLLYNIVDRVYIGHIPGIGTDALAGVGVTSSVIILIMAFSQIVSGGGAPLAAMALGRGDRERAEKILGNGVSLLLLFTLLNAIPVYVFMRPILLATGASAATVGYAEDYLSIYLIGTLSVQIATGLNTYINCQGRAGIAMLSVVIGAVLNIVLDPFFIFTCGMGVKGAAVATVLSQTVSGAWVLGFLLSRKATLRVRLSRMKPDKRILGPVIALGIAPFIMASTESLVGFVLNGTLQHYGDIYVSALTVMQSAMQFVSVPLSGFAQGFVPIVSYNYGHRNPERVKQCFWLTLAVMFTFNLVAVLLLMVFPGPVARLFTDDAALVAKVADIMPVFLAGMTIFGLQRECQNMFVSLGQAKISLFIALLRKVLLLVPLAILLSKVWGVMGVYTAEAIADGTAAILCTGLFAVRFPRILRGIGGTTAEAAKE